MRKLSFLLISIIMVTSCATDGDDEVTDVNFLGEWELVKTIGQFDASERTGADMEWQETYTLREDGTFTKKRVRDGEMSTVEGTYLLNDEPFTQNPGAILNISMIYELENNLISTCYSERLREELYFPDKELLKGTWHQCDGLELEYRKIEN